MLYQLAYASSAAGSQTPETIADILRVSHINNVRDGLTGMLLIANACYFQVLEGEQENVEACTQRIERDPRHAGILVTSRGSIETRAFPEWSMGCEKLQNLPLAKLAQDQASAAFDIASVQDQATVARLAENAPVLMVLMKAFFLSSGYERRNDGGLFPGAKAG